MARLTKSDAPHIFDEKNQAQPAKKHLTLTKFEKVCQNAKVNDYLHFPVLSFYYARLVSGSVVDVHKQWLELGGNGDGNI